MNLKIDPTEKLFIYNNTLQSTSAAKIDIPENYKVFYEVIRVIKGKALFLDEHLDRLKQSLALSNIPCISIEESKTSILNLLEKNYVEEKNLKINFFCDGKKQNLYAYFVESHYPSKQTYLYGVKVELLPIERNTPNVKLENPLLRGSADKAICMSQTHEMLLVNANGFITEGSRSNFFAIKGNLLITPPSSQVLEGITRKMVVQLAKRNSIEIEEKPIHCSEIYELDGAFITGTSSKVLPIIKIGDYTLPGFPEITKKLMFLYDELVKETIGID
jgi:branched-chain amino acid aminotransferase